MAVVLAGVALAGALAFFGGDADKVKQEIDTEVNFDILNSVSVTSGVTITQNIAGMQGFTFVADNCTIGNINVQQSIGTQTEIYAFNSSQTDATFITQIKAEIQNQIEQSVKKVSDSLGQFLDKFSRSTDQEQTLNNAFSESVSTVVTVDAFVSIQSSIWNSQTVTLTCKDGSFQDVTIDQSIVVNATVKGILNNVVTVFSENQSVVDIVNQAKQQFEKVTTSTILIIIAAIIIVLVIGGVIFFVVRYSKRKQQLAGYGSQQPTDTRQQQRYQQQQQKYQQEQQRYQQQYGNSQQQNGNSQQQQYRQNTPSTKTPSTARRPLPSTPSTTSYT